VLDKTKKHGRTLKLFLIDGTPTGLLIAELGNWSGKAVVAPRTALFDLLKRPEASRSGVYLLMGPDPATVSGALVYVGEGDNPKARIMAHDSDETKQFFTRVCLIVSKDDNLTKAHIRYLESRLLGLIRAAARAKAVNEREPEPKGLPELEVADMEGFLSELGVLLPVLGFDILRLPGDGVTKEQPVFVFTEVGTSARARELGGEFVVLSGSLARGSETNTLYEGSKTKRHDLVSEGALVPDQGGEVLAFYS
jgi:hypothetical protein